MNQEQLFSAIRTLLQVASTALVAKGVIDEPSAATIVNEVMIAIPALVLVGTTVWSLWAHRPHGVIAMAADQSDVAKVVTVKQSTADAIPSSKVVSAAQAKSA